PADQSPPDDPGLDVEASSALSEIIDTRLARQVQLSLDFFIAQPDGMAVDEVMVCGGSSQIEGLADLLQDRLGMPVSILEEPTIPELLLNATPPTPMANFGVSAGEAITGLELAPVQVDFLPERYRITLSFPKGYVAFMVAMLCAMV